MASGTCFSANSNTPKRRRTATPSDRSPRKRRRTSTGKTTIQILVAIAWMTQAQGHHPRKSLSLDVYVICGEQVSFAKFIDKLLRPAPEPGDPLMPKCDSCPREATVFYKSRPRNASEQPGYHAFCDDHCNPLDGTGQTSLEQYVCEYIHES